MHLFSGSATFRSDAHLGMTWSKYEKTPVVKNSDGQLGFKLISTVSARGDMYFDAFVKSMAAEKLSISWKNYVKMLVVLSCYFTCR